MSVRTADAKSDLVAVRLTSDTTATFPLGYGPGDIVGFSPVYAQRLQDSRRGTILTKGAKGKAKG